MSKVNLAFSFAAVSLLFSIIVQGASCRSKEANMSNSTVAQGERLAAGTWGGEHLRMKVTAQEAQLEYDCARGAIDQPITLDAQGRFNVTGSLIREHGGPVRRNEGTKSAPVRYAGELKDGTLTLTVSTAEKDEHLGTFTLTHGSEGQLRKCR